MLITMARKSFLQAGCNNCSHLNLLRLTEDIVEYIDNNGYNPTSGSSFYKKYYSSN